MTPGACFRSALREESPLQIAGVINAYVAIMAKELGFRALYLSGAGVANSCYGLPDLAMTTLDNVLEEVRRIAGAVSLPLLVDIDTGWGGVLMIQRVIREMIRAGAAAAHLEDQVAQKRCGHRPGKELVSVEEMEERIAAAVQGKTDPDFVLMARTDALAVEGLDAALRRAQAYQQAGADALFAEACTRVEDFRAFKEAVSIPVLANLTEFGKTPLFTLEEMKETGVDMVLYPLSANRAMNRAAYETLKTIREEGSQQSCLDKMQTREQLYAFLHYHEWEGLARKT